MNEITDATLRILHGSAAGFHLIQAVYGEVLVNTAFKDRSVFPVTNPVYQHEDKVIGTYDLSQLAPVFSFLSAANHLWAVSDFQNYLQFVERGYNPVRWLEYSVSAGLMFYMIAVMSGIVDIKTLMLLALSNVALQFTGYSIEKDTAHSIRYDDKNSYQVAMRQQVTGFLIFLAQIVCIWTAFFTSVTSFEDDVPLLVWFIIFFITALFLSFGLLSMAYTRGAGKQRGLSERNFKKIEVGYIILSFIAKTFLMNSVLFGSVNRTDQK